MVDKISSKRKAEAAKVSAMEQDADPDMHAPFITEPEVSRLDLVMQADGQPRLTVEDIADVDDGPFASVVDEETGSKSEGTDDVHLPPIDEERLRYTVSGPGIVEATMRQPTRFKIEAVTPSGDNVATKNMSFFIAIRGVARVRAKVVAADNDAYNVEWKPSVSGLYSIAISKGGKPLRGSPFSVTASTPLPCPRNCLVKGSAVRHAIAREPQEFQVCFKDKLGLTTSAVDLDVFVEPALKKLSPATGVDSSPLPMLPEEDSMCGPSDSESPAPSAASPGAEEQEYMTKQRAIRVKVGEKALVVRAGFELNSKPLGQVAPGVTVTVVEERIMDGYVRGCIYLDDSMRELHNPRGDPKAESSVTFRSSSSTFRVKHLSDEDLSRLVHSPTRLPGPYAQQKRIKSAARRSSALSESNSPAYNRSPRLQDAASLTAIRESEPSTPIVNRAEANNSLPPTPTDASPLGPAAGDAFEEGSASSEVSPAVQNTRGERESAPLRSRRKPSLKLRVDTVTPFSALAQEEEIDMSLLRARRKAPKLRVDAVGGPSGGSSHRTSQRSSRSHRDAVPSYRGVVLTPQRSHRGSNAAKGGSSSAPKSSAKVGWITMVKDGNKLVSSRLRLDVSTRQRHTEQWLQRLKNDKRGASDQTKSIRSELGPALSRPLSMELAVDGAGFAFGGLFPGTLHAHGMLRESHRVSYSIAAAGEYMLHVRLRKQAAALPGSPFLLQVDPGAAFAQTSTLPFEPLRSEVGCALQYVMGTGDKIGNPCKVGGAEIRSWCEEKGVKAGDITATCEDRNDGTYLLEWNSMRPGVFVTHVKIEGRHVVNSPGKITFVSTVPQFDMSQLDGLGLKQAVVGEYASIAVKLLDRFENEAVPTADFRSNFRIGLSFVKASMTGQVADEPHHDVQVLWKSEDSGDLEIRYRPHRDNQGFCELHLWCMEHEGAEHTYLPGSPFSLSISSNINEVVSNDLDTTGAAPHDYRVVRRVFDESQARWGACSLDAFASEPTALVARFWTAAKCDNSCGTNAFRQRWEYGERIWAHPPPDLLPKLSSLLQRETRGAEVLICAPLWPSTNWFRDIASLADEKYKYPAGMLQRVVDNAPARLESWPIVVFHVPPNAAAINFEPAGDASLKQGGDEGSSTPPDEGAPGAAPDPDAPFQVDDTGVQIDLEVDPIDNTGMESAEPEPLEEPLADLC